MADVVTYGGIGIIAGRIKGLGTEPKYIGWGTGSGTMTRDRTTLFTEAAEARVAGTSSIATVAHTGDTYVVAGTMTSGSIQDITNAGLHDAPKPGGTLFMAKDFPAYPVGVGNTIGFSFKCQLL